VKNKLLTFAGALALLALLGHFYAKPLLASVAALVRDVDNGALQPVNFKITVNDPSADASATVEGPTVPAGKRLVVEDVSVFGLIPSSTALTGVWLVNQGGTNYLLVNPETGERSVSTDGSLSQYGYNRPAKIYYDPGDVVQIQIFRDSLTPGTPIPTGIFLVNVYVHGYYVNVP
jgi:hypothetical protein